MGRRKSKLSIPSILYQFCSNVAVVLGIASEPRRNRRVATKRCNRRVNVAMQNENMNKHTRSKCLEMKERDDYQCMKLRGHLDFNNICQASELTILNTNNNRSVDKLAYDDIDDYRLSNVDQRQILCILVKNTDRIQDLVMKYPLIFKDSRIIHLQELIELIQSTTTITTANATHEDASTMINTDQICRRITSCDSFITQSENSRRLKALEFIRVFIEMSKEDFFKYLINEEHLCQQKTLAIYQMIKEFLKVIYQSEHRQKQKAL